MNAEIFVQIG